MRCGGFLLTELLSLLAEKNVTYYRTSDAYVCLTSNGKKLKAAQY